MVQAVGCTGMLPWPQLFTWKPAFQQSQGKLLTAIKYAAGQTGSGKTHTMQGAREDPGVNFRALDDLFRLIAARSPEADYEIHVSLTEVTCLACRLLHAPSPLLDTQAQRLHAL